MSNISGKIVNLLSNIYKNGASLHEPTLGKVEVEYLKNCIESGFVSYAGEMVNEFEKRLSIYTGCKNVISTVSGTSALHLSLYALGVKHNDEVFTPSISFVATSNAIYHSGARPYFIDCDQDDFGISPSSLNAEIKLNTIQKKGCLFNKKNGRKISAILATHVFGHSCKINELKKISKKYNLLLIEDAAECMGSFLDNKHLGTFGDLGILSFNGNKTITTGGGGAILVNNSSLAEKIRHISTTAKLKHPWEYNHDQIGFNYRMPNLNASLGCAQLLRLDELLHKKRQLYEVYKNNFMKIKEVHLGEEKLNSKSNYWLHYIYLKGNNYKYKDEIIGKCVEKKINLRPLWKPLHELKMNMQASKSTMLETTDIYNRVICLPSDGKFI